MSTMNRREFRAMNADCLILAAADDAVGECEVSRAVQVVHCYERKFSRFLEDSELSRLNNDERDEVPVSRELAAIVSRAIYYAELTNGVFDPVVLRELRALGYDRSFELVERDAAAAKPVPRTYTWRDVYVDRTRHVVNRPAGAMIDLGGLAKGAAADAALGQLAHFPGALVDLGGDVRVNGQPEGFDAWNVGYDDATGEQRAILSFHDAAVATSSTAKRRWNRGGQPVHHIIDPRTGASADTNVAQCSVIADTTEHAEVGAKLGLILGAGSISERDDIAVVLGLRGVAWNTNDNEYVATEGWKESCAVQ
ncbi:MAG: FAD:protein FMN transferase [Chloroflexota bacterium]